MTDRINQLILYIESFAKDGLLPADNGGYIQLCAKARAELAKLRRDRERLEWVFEHCAIAFDENTLIESLEEIDAAMEATDGPANTD